MTNTDERQWVIKLAVLGDPAVGKTSLINQYIQHSFDTSYLPTLGVNIVIKDIKIENTNNVVRLTLWDIAGQSKYDLTRKMFFQGCEGVLLVYDITRPLTLNNIQDKWFKEFKKYANQDSIYILIGNKVDLRTDAQEQFMSFENGNNYAESIKACDFIETSAKAGNNVEKSFETLYKEVLKKHGQAF